VSYLVLARKYRPRSFAQMAGQDHVVRALTHALEQRRLHHAYLFTGTRGIGKTTVSRILAKSLNCIGPDGHGEVTPTPCGVCAPCREIDADRHVDYIELDAASNRSIDEIRDLIERAAYKPTVGRYKVFMIDEAHQLTKDAFNALLKTLEEPPEYLKFVLATTDPERMLPTVLSRCLQFNLRPMPPEVVREHLERVLQAESVSFDEGSLRLIGRAARGSMRDALSLTDQAIAYGAGQLLESGVAAMLGLAGGEACDDVLRALARRDGAEVVRCAQALREAGVPPASALEQMAQWLQQVALAQIAPDTVDLQGPQEDLARALAEAFAPDEVQLLYSIVLHGRAELSLMSDEHAAFTMVLLRYLAFPGAGPGPGPEGAGEALVGRAGSRALPSVAPTPPASPAPRAAALRIEVPPPRATVTAGAIPLDALTEARAAVPTTALAVQRQRSADLSPGRQGTAQLHRGAAGPPETNVAADRATDAPFSTPPAFAARDDRTAVAVEGSDGRGPSQAMPAPSTPPADPPGVDGALADRWDALARRMSAEGLLSGLVRELAWQSALVAIESGDPPVWRLRVGHESLRGQALRSKLEQTLAVVEAGRLRIDVDVGEPFDTPAQRDATARARRQQEAEQAIREDPLVQDLLARFASARIVPGSIRPV